MTEPIFVPPGRCREFRRLTRDQKLSVAEVRDLMVSRGKGHSLRSIRDHTFGRCSHDAEDVGEPADPSRQRGKHIRRKWESS